MVEVKTTDIVVVVFISIPLYNFLELHVLILSTFKRWKGFYFWSFTISTWGVAFHSVGYLLKHRALTTMANLYACKTYPHRLVHHNQRALGRIVLLTASLTAPQNTASRSTYHDYHECSLAAYPSYCFSLRL